MHIILNHSSMVPIYEQVMDRVKNEIINGTLKADTPLPSVRTLSSDLKISALTVKKAYDKLEEEGFVVTVHGKGTFVAKAESEHAAEAMKKAVEDEFVRTIDKAKSIGMSSSDIIRLMEILLEE